jgi:hypothetical protein
MFAALSLYGPKRYIMKQVLLFLTISVGVSTQLAAQEPSDALRYSWLSGGGTARNQAIGGTNVSLGGDLSSIFYNPAGLGMYKTGELVLSPGFSFENNKAEYLGSNARQNASQFNFGATGVILPMGTRKEKMRNVTIGIGVNRVANFNNTVYFNGKNNQSSYSEKYLEELINNNVTDPNSAASNFPYGASLAFNTYLVDTIRGAGGSIAGYRSLATPQTGVNQEQTITTAGGMTEVGFAMSANMSDKFYFGGSLNWSVLKYERTSFYKESDATTNARNNFNYFSVEDFLSTTGIGVNLKLGMIFKPVEQVRIGLAFHTPTFYNMEDRYATTLTTDLEGYAGAGTQTQSSRDFNNGLDGEFAYNLNNPLRVMGGISYVFREDQDITKQRGFISADVEYLNYKASSFSASDPANNSAAYFNDLNSTIDNLYRSAINLRVGGELKFETIMARAGFAYFGNPYQSTDVNGSRMNLSGGFGYRDKGKFIDITYVHQIAKDAYYPYRLDNGTFSPVNMNTGTGNILLTFGFKF